MIAIITFLKLTPIWFNIRYLFKLIFILIIPNEKLKILGRYYPSFFDDKHTSKSKKKEKGVLRTS